MTQASYTAWDDKQYVWPPPDGWYQAADQKWWPEGYGPPEVEPEPEPQPETHRETQLESAGQHMEATARYSSAADEPAGHEPGGHSPADNESAIREVVGEAKLESEPLRTASLGLSPLPTEADTSWRTSPPAADTVFDPGSDFDGSSEREQVTPTEEVVNLAAADVSAEMIGTDLLQSLADPSEAPDGLVVDEGLAVDEFSADGGVDQTAAQQTIQARSGSDHSPSATAVPVADRDDILTAPEKGSSRGLLFAALGVLALVGVGVALFFALGGDGESPDGSNDIVTTGPGSLSEPHPRVTAVVVFYPDGDDEQRWIIEVLEPASDKTAEIGSGDSPDTGIYAATRVRVTNDSGNDGASLEDVRFNFVDSSGQVLVRTENPCPDTADDLGYEASVPLDGSVEGTVCWAVAADALPEAMLGIESSKVQGRIHIQLQ